MNHAIRVHELGGPDVLRWEAIDTPAPAKGEVLVRSVAVGLNFLDTYFRSGLYPMALPFIVGSEGAGVVEAVGAEVVDFSVGDNVAYVDPLGSYAEYLVRPVSRLVKLPDDIAHVDAAAMMLKGLTAEYLVQRTYAVKAGDTILVHAAAGGVGQILCQWAAHLGATVIGTVGSEDKRAIAEASGCQHVIVTSPESGTADFAPVVRELTNGEGVAVVYDGVGAATFTHSLKCVRIRGHLVAFGAASGAVPPIDIQLLNQNGSIYLTRPSLGAYARTTEELRQAADTLFAVVKSGAVRIAPPRTYALSDAAQAHRDLEARKTTGSVVLVP